MIEVQSYQVKALRVAQQGEQIAWEESDLLER